MNTLNKNITRMIGSYPTSYRGLNQNESFIQEVVEATIRKDLTSIELNNFYDQIENHCNDYFVKAFRRQYSLEKAAELTPDDAIQFAVTVSKTVAS